MAKITFHHFLLLELLLAIFLFSTCVQAITDPTDVQALQVLYTSLNNAAQLTNWKNNVGDPCGESWRGITCQGTAVVSIQLPGLGLDGTLGYLLAGFVSLKTLDFSGNNIHDTIPYQLPPNLTSVNFANNNLSGGLPYSIAMMFNLNYVNLSRNALAQNIVDVFTNLTSLATLDLSHNNFTGDLPNSISSLSNITTLHVQNNQLTGSLSALSGLSLTDLNIANNNFTGWIPRELLSLPTFIYDGNSFENGPAPPPPPYTSPPPARSNNNRSRSPPSRIPTDYDGQSSNTSNRKKLSVGAIIGISVGSAFLVLLGLLVLVFCFRKGKKKKNARKTSIGSRPISVNTEIQEQRVKPTASMLDLRSSPAEDSMFELQKDGSTKRVRSPITATSYTVAALQTATNSFSQENIIGEGSLGRVYKAEFPNGKMMAIKKIDNAALSLPDQDKFVEAVSNMSRLRHPNIVLLAGYCAEHGQRLLVYEYVANGSLQDLLHLADDRSKSLTWNARVRVALGTARALEYLHEVCLPSVVHRNFKSANILLDEDLNPHLSDCGLAALTPNTEREVSTQMVGSFGYSAPEFALSGVYTVKSDVYSFGVVMLELLTGRKPLDSSRVRSEQSLVRWAIPQLHDIDLLAKMVDPALNGMYPAKSLSRFADVIALCVQPEPEFRPPMSEVVQALVRLMQRASIANRRTSEDSGFIYRTPDHEAYETTC
ncbi:protein STRUBBELIG-RECEPTOR FAMILY 8-like [Cynara cardunculus var. scolymus]|uniref:protein STRUBBELIG-RECEPTOR FAMILY 8-like n=1 Tax=Cynara cardunculus var. scolymus TaxID=59895 RepID=UPI000D629C35|nr:protein STRUBBELIG-RECEPTOR FAMILY 8-like [Cynara cardunculus var. scolymus]